MRRCTEAIHTQGRTGALLSPDPPHPLLLNTQSHVPPGSPVHRLASEAATGEAKNLPSLTPPNPGVFLSFGPWGPYSPFAWHSSFQNKLRISLRLEWGVSLPVPSMSPWKLSSCSPFSAQCHKREEADNKSTAQPLKACMG